MDALPKAWKVFAKDFKQDDRLQPESHAEWWDGGMRGSMPTVGL
jgi:hypothetical protein